MTKLELLRHRRDDCLKALHEILRSGQSVTIEGMTITRADIDKVNNMLNDLENQIAAEERAIKSKTRSRVRVVVPL